MSLTNFDQADVTDMFTYLDELRASGATNMFGAGSYLAAEYALERREASKVLMAWMDTFGSDMPDQRAAKALSQKEKGTEND